MAGRRLLLRRSRADETGDALVPEQDKHAARWSSVATVRARALEQRSQLEARRSTNPFVDVGFRFLQRDRESGAGLLAGAIAFRFFMFLVPCVFLFVVGLGLGAEEAGASVHDVARKAGIAGVAATAIQSGADAPTVTRWATVLVAAFAVIAALRNLVKVLWVAHALIWKVPLERPRKSARAAIGIMVCFLTGVGLVRLIAVLRDATYAGWLVGLALFVLVPAAMWLVGSMKLFPAESGVTWQHLLPGALLFGVGIEALHLFTVLYVARSIESKSAAYGTIGAALTMLLWAYLLGRLVTSAAVLNAALWSSPQRIRIRRKESA